MDSVTVKNGIGRIHVPAAAYRRLPGRKGNEKRAAEFTAPTALASLPNPANIGMHRSVCGFNKKSTRFKVPKHKSYIYDILRTKAI